MTQPSAASGAAVVLGPDAIGRLPWRRLHDPREAQTRVLWQYEGSLAGILRLGPGEGLSSHAHPEAHHHVWILSGGAKILGTMVGAGSYIHVPAGMEHAVEDVGPDGLTMLYLYLMVD